MKFKSILMATAIMMLTLCGLIAQNSKNSKILVMYFSWGGTTEKMAKMISSLDATSGASVTIKDGKHFGNAQFIAMTVTDTMGKSADLFEIDTVDHYPRDYKKSSTQHKASSGKM